MQIFIGIDPGITGAMAILSKNDNHIKAEVFDFDDYGSENLMTLAKLSAMNSGGRAKVYAAVEAFAVFKGQNVYNQARYVANYGQWLGRLESALIPTAIVHARSWKKLFSKYLDEGLFEPKDAKDAALHIARHIYPDLKDELKLKKHHNRADAILIAEFLRLNYQDLEFKVAC